MELALPAAVAALSLAASWSLCLRPVRHGRHCAARRRDEEVAALRAEVVRLRSEQQVSRGR